MGFDIEKEKFQIEKDGKLVDCDLWFTFHSEDTMKAYFGYTDHSFGENGRQNIYVSAADLLDPKAELENVTDPDELAMVYDVLQEIDKEANS